MFCCGNCTFIHILYENVSRWRCLKSEDYDIVRCFLAFRKSSNYNNEQFYTCIGSNIIYLISNTNLCSS